MENKGKVIVISMGVALIFMGIYFIIHNENKN